MRFPALDLLDDIALINAIPADGCSPLRNDPASLQGAAVLVRRGNCRFTVKAAAAQAAGAALVVVVDAADSPDGAETMYATASDTGSSGIKPDDYANVAAVMVENAAGEALMRYAGVRVGSNNATEGIRVSGPVPYVAPGHHEFRLSAFSSRGPTKDGRLKPDVLAPGEYIISARSDGDLRSFQCSTNDGSTLKAMQGTSMAAPVAASAAVMIREYLMKGFYPTGTETAPQGVFELTPAAARPEAVAGMREHRSSTGALISPTSADAFEPSAALVKALLVHSAVAVGGPVRSAVSKTGFETVPPPPSVYQGHGRIKLDNVLTFADGTDTDSDTVNPGGSAISSAAVPQPSVFMMDYASNPASDERWYGGPTATASAATGDTHLYCFDLAPLMRSALSSYSANRSYNVSSNGVPRARPFHSDGNVTAAFYPYAFSATADPYVRATLAYTDYPASLASGRFLVNDLDLTAVVTGVSNGPNANAEAVATRGRSLARMFVGNEGADYDGAGRKDISDTFPDATIGESFYEQITNLNSDRNTARAGSLPPLPGDAASRAARGGTTWDHSNNLEALTITATDLLGLAAGGTDSAAAADALAAADVSALAAAVAARDWYLSVLVHGTAVPHGPQPFALVVSTLHGGVIQETRLPAGRCARAAGAEPVPTVTTPPAAPTVNANANSSGNTNIASAVAAVAAAATAAVTAAVSAVNTAINGAATAAGALPAGLSLAALCPNACSGTLENSCCINAMDYLLHYVTPKGDILNIIILNIINITIQISHTILFLTCLILWC